MEESKIIIRYGCDGCGQYFADERDLRRYEVRFMRQDLTSGGRGSIIFDNRQELLCEMCAKSRDMSRND